jgi:hypothetical protein
MRHRPQSAILANPERGTRPSTEILFDRAPVSGVFLGVVFNAFVIAILATVHPRYQSGVAWLLLIGLMAALQAVPARDWTHRCAHLPTAK